MEFRLVYRGILPPNGKPEDKMTIRRAFHKQLRELWRQQPLKGEIENFHLHIDPKYEDQDSATFLKKDPFLFLPLVCRKLKLIAELNILFLRPDEPGLIIDHSGDLDNRLKTLFDALAIPRELPLNSSPATDETPFYVLLEDDALITGFSVQTDRLLDSTKKEEVLLVIQVRLAATEGNWINLALT